MDLGKDFHKYDSAEVVLIRVIIQAGLTTQFGQIIHTVN